MATPVSDWLRHSQFLLCDRYLEFSETWKEARSKRPLPRLCFSGRFEKQDGHSGFWLAETFSASPLKLMNGIQKNSQEARSQRLLSRLWFSGLSEEQDSRPACDWLRHFRFLLWNHWMEFNKIWQDARSQRPLISLCFSGRSEEKDGRPASDLPRHFDFSSVTAEQDSTKLDRKQDLSVLYQFVLFGPIKKATLSSDWLRHFRLLLCDRWTEFNETWQEAKFQRPLQSSCYSIDETWQEARYQCPIVWFFWADEKNKMAAPASDWLGHFRLLLWTEFNKTWQEIRYVNAIFQVCVFRADRKNILLMFTICGPWSSCFCIK